MTTILLLVPVVLSLLVLGAHFLRAGIVPLALVPLALVGLLFVRRRWTAPVVQAALVVGALEWVRTLVALTGERIRAGSPYGRMAAILGFVALVTAASALAFRAAPLRRWFGEPGAPSGNRQSD